VKTLTLCHQRGYVGEDPEEHTFWFPASQWSQQTERQLASAVRGRTEIRFAACGRVCPGPRTWLGPATVKPEPTSEGGGWVDVGRGGKAVQPGPAAQAGPGSDLHNGFAVIVGRTEHIAELVEGFRPQGSDRFIDEAGSLLAVEMPRPSPDVRESERLRGDRLIAAAKVQISGGKAVSYLGLASQQRHPHDCSLAAKMEYKLESMLRRVASAEFWHGIARADPHPSGDKGPYSVMFAVSQACSEELATPPDTIVSSMDLSLSFPYMCGLGRSLYLSDVARSWMLWVASASPARPLN
jgi:hypothetical protein